MLSVRLFTERNKTNSLEDINSFVNSNQRRYFKTQRHSSFSSTEGGTYYFKDWVEKGPANHLSHNHYIKNYETYNKSERKQFIVSNNKF